MSVKYTYDNVLSSRIERFDYRGDKLQDTIGPFEDDHPHDENSAINRVNLRLVNTSINYLRGNHCLSKIYTKRIQYIIVFPLNSRFP